MRIPRYERSVAPTPISTGGAQTSLGVTSPVAPARQPDVFGPLSQLATDIIKREGEKKDRTDALNAISALSEESLMMQGEAMKSRGTNAEGITAATLDRFNEALDKVELSGMRERAWNSVQEWAIRRGDSLGRLLQRHERSETDAALLAAQDAAATAMMDELGAFRGNLEGGYDAEALTASENDVRGAVRAAGVSQGLDAATIKLNEDRAVSAGLKAAVGGMLADGDVAVARLMLKDQGGRMTGEDRAAVKAAVEAHENSAWAVDLAAAAGARLPGEGTWTERRKFIREQGAKAGRDTKTIDAAITRARNDYIAESETRREQDLMLERRVLSGQATGADWGRYEARFGSDAAEKGKNRLVERETRGAWTYDQMRNREQWKAMLDTDYLDMNKDQAIAFSRKLPIDDSGPFLDEWSRVTNTMLSAAQRAGVERKPSGPTMFSPSQVGADLIARIPGEKDDPRRNQLVSGVRQVMNAAFSYYTSQGDDKETASRKATDAGMESLILRDRDGWGGLNRKDWYETRASVPSDIEVGTIFVPPDMRTEYEAAVIVPLVQRMVNEGGAGLSWTPEDVDDLDDSKLAYALAIRRILNSGDDTAREAAAGALNNLFGPDSARRLATGTW